MSFANAIGPQYAGSPQLAAAQSMRPGEAQSRAAIARAAADTGVDFDYLLAQAKLESALNPAARARTSSASGLYQFIDNTWLETMDRHGARLGFGEIADAIETRGGRARVSNPGQRDAILQMRFDPDAAALIAGALASDNRAHLGGVLGREPQPAELYLAHFLGAKGAEKFLAAMDANPDAAAAPLMPKAAAANRSIFYSGGSPRSLQSVLGLFERKMDAAMEGAPPPTAAPQTPFAPWAAVASQFQAEASAPVPSAAQRAYRTPSLSSPALPAMPNLPSPASRPSMADMLRDSFGAGGGAPSAHVERAYSKLKAFNL